MIDRLSNSVSMRWMYGMALGLTFVMSPALAEETPERTALKVCVDGDNMPYSNSKAEGFENKIAELFAEELGLPVEFTYFPQQLGFARNTLKNEVSIGVYKCDLIMGVPSSYDIAATTQPYYRTTYVLAYVKGAGFDAVKKPEDVAELPTEVKDKIVFGLFDRGPAQLWVFENDLMTQIRIYRSSPGTVSEGPGDVMRDLADGKINMTMVYGPFAGWWAQKLEKEQGLDIVTIPMTNDPDNPEMRFEFDMSMAVRYGEKEWKARVNQFIENNREEIQAILDEYNIPTLDLGQKI